MPTPRGLLRAVFAGGLLYAVVGLDAQENPLNAVEAYAPATNRWYSKAPIPDLRGEPAMATLTDGRILAAGGCCTATGAPLSDVELYTPSSDQRQQLTPLPEGRSSLARAAFGDDAFLAIGGFEENVQAQSIVVAAQLAPPHTPTVGRQS